MNGILALSDGLITGIASVVGIAVLIGVLVIAYALADYRVR